MTSPPGSTTIGTKKPLLLVALIGLLAFNGANANLYSEGGTFSAKSNRPQERSTTQELNEFPAEYFESTDYQEPNLYRTESNPAIEQERQRQRLANIVEQLRQRQAQSPQELAQGPGYFVDEEGEQPLLNPEVPHQRNRNAEELSELRRLGEAIRNMNKVDGEEFNGETETAEPMGGGNKKLEAVKKGQSEFVEFVEPGHNNRLKAVEWMEKRVPVDHNRRDSGSPFNFLSSGSVLFVAYLTICCVGVVVGTVGGVYYYNHVRATRVDDPFNEFTRYSPSGPGKDKLKRGSPTFGQTGDDTLAYKAQLHHYQQQKQKILGSQQPPVTSDTMSDNEEDTDELEHNFSVFECPGLAPTGDVEIQNPNFVGDGGDKKAAEKKDRVE